MGEKSQNQTIQQQDREFSNKLPSLVQERQTISSNRYQQQLSMSNERHSYDASGEEQTAIKSLKEKLQYKTIEESRS